MTVAAATPASGYNTLNREEQGGKVWVVEGQLIIGTGGGLVLPTADPVIEGALWNNAGTITISAG